MLKETSTQVTEIGDFCFMNENTVLFLCYPDALNDDGKGYSYIPIKTEDKPSSKPHAWDWNGNIESPTLSPSINIVGRWHGYLRDGNIVGA